MTMNSEWLFSIYYIFTGLVQRIFKCNKIQDITLTLDKVLNILYMDYLSVSSYTRVTNF